MSASRGIAKANPAVIGGFVLAALALAAGAVIVLGGAALFAPKQNAVIYFERPVNGLSVGAPVNFRGVKVGRVDRIHLQFDPGSLVPRIPVYITLMPEQIQFLGAGEPGQAIPLEAYITRGLRAQLSLESIVTGQLVVDLDFRPDIPAVFRNDGSESQTEIPSMKSGFDALMEELARLPMRELAGNIGEMVQAFNQLASGAGGTLGIAGKELKATGAAARQTLATAQGSLQSFNQSMSSIERTSEQARATLQAAQPELLETLRSARLTLARMETSLQNADATMAQMAEMTAPGTPARADLEQTLRDLSESAESLRQFADTLERKPNALLFGKE